MIEFWIAMAVIIGGIIYALALPTRVQKNERDIDQWKIVTIEQKAILNKVSENQTLLIERALDD